MGEGTSQIIMLVLILGVFYFFMIRPQMKKQKELKKFREGLSEGDKVVTIGGIHGKILEVNDANVLLNCEGGSKLRVEKSALTNGTDGQQLAQKK
ncbi:MAG: preprotein translocase subunit YajC [Bacteroidota bacterium]